MKVDIVHCIQLEMLMRAIISFHMKGLVILIRRSLWIPCSKAWESNADPTVSNWSNSAATLYDSLSKYTLDEYRVPNGALSRVSTLDVHDNATTAHYHDATTAHCHDAAVHEAPWPALVSAIIRDEYSIRSIRCQYYYSKRCCQYSTTSSLAPCDT